MAWAPCTSVPAVSIMSSEIIATLPRDVADHVRDHAPAPCSGRSLVRIASSPPSISANFLASFVAARVGRHDDEALLGQPDVAEVLREHRQGRHVIDRDAEEALHLARVEVHGEHAVDACGLEHVGHQARA